MKRDFLSIQDLTAGELENILARAQELKTHRSQRTDLAGKTLATVFEKPSTRTRVSFEVAMLELGGHALALHARDLQLGRGEEIRDTARTLSGYVSALMIRANHHQTLEECARFATIPVINGLSDREHPCQTLADLLTLRERFGSLNGLRVAWIGDGNNVCHSLILSAPLTGLDLRVAAPPAYAPSEPVVRRARSQGGSVRVTGDPKEAARNADALYTDVWVSMGEEAEREQKTETLKGYALTPELIGMASERAVVMHCLPAHRGEEITDAIMESSRSVIWTQAENRLHAQKALLLALLGSPPGP